MVGVSLCALLFTLPVQCTSCFRNKVFASDLQDWMCLDFSSAVLWNISLSFFLEGVVYEKTKRQSYLKSSEARERSKDPMVVYKARFEEHFGGVDELKRGRPALPRWMEMDQLCL